MIVSADPFFDTQARNLLLAVAALRKASVHLF